VFAFKDDRTGIHERVLGGDPENPGRLRTRSHTSSTGKDPSA